MRGFVLLPPPGHSAGLKQKTLTNNQKKGIIMSKIKVNGADFEYQEYGSGTTVIFIHGGISDYRIWNNQIDAFSKYYHVITYSRRYHYPNKWEGDGSDYSVTLHAQDLAALILTMKPGKVNLIGNSYGAYIALLTALDHPELVNALVLNEPPVLPLLVSNFNNPLQILSLFIRDFKTAKNLMEFGSQHIKPAAKALKENQMERGVRLFADGALGKGGFEKIPEEAKKTFIDNAPALRAESLGPGFPPSFPIDKAKQLDIPVLFVYGENSPRFLISISDRLMKILPKSEKIIIPNASHLTHGENPIAYNEKVLEFLANHPVNAGK